MKNARKWIMAGVIAIGALGVAFGCSMAMRPGNTDGNKENSKPLVHFRAITLGNMPEGGMDEIYERLDALTIPELNCTLRFEFIPWGNEKQQLNIVTASGEYDFIPGGVFSDYRTLVFKNAFLDLNEYLWAVPELMEHYAIFDEDTLKKCEINGGLYGLPQFAAGELKNEAAEGFFYREDLRKEWGLEEIHDLETMEAYLYRAKQEEVYWDKPLVTDNRIWGSLWIMLTQGKYLEIRSIQETPFVVVEASNPYVVLNRMETPEFKEVLAYIQKWKQDGILDSALLARSDNEGELGKSLVLADKKPCETNTPLWSVNSYWIPELYATHPEWEFGFFQYIWNDKEFFIGSLAGRSVMSISSKTVNPELALKLLEKIHTDQRYYDLVAYGVEGIHYSLVDGKISVGGANADNRFNWTAVSDDIMNYEGVPVNEKWAEEVYRANLEWIGEVSKTAEDYPLDGFTFQPTGLEREVEAMEQVWRLYFQPLVCGYEQDYLEALEEANARLGQIGFERYLEAMQSQIEEFCGVKSY